MAPVVVPIATWLGASAAAAGAAGAVATGAAVVGSAVYAKKSLDKLTKPISQGGAVTTPKDVQVQPTTPEPDVAAPKLSSQPVQKAVDVELQRARKQKGRASTILSNKPIIDDAALGGTARQTLGV